MGGESPRVEAGEPEVKHFDEVVTVEPEDGPPYDEVVHRNAQGEIYCFHSPLEHGPIHCDVCTMSGTRIWVGDEVYVEIQSEENPK